MHKFWSLVKKEWHMYKAWPIIFLIAGGVFIGVLPMFENRFPTSMTEEELRLQFMIVAMLFIGAAIPSQFLLSIRRDIKVKELWLHNASAMTTLIGAKLTYTVLWIVSMSIFYTLPFHFMGMDIIGKTGQIISLQLFAAFMVFVFSLLLPLMALPFYAFYLLLKRYISYGSLLVTGAVFGAFLFLVEKVSTSELYGILLYHGEVSLGVFEKNMPEFTNGTFLIIGSMYIVEELAMWLLMAVCFIAGSKWIERVITR